MFYRKPSSTCYEYILRSPQDTHNFRASAHNVIMILTVFAVGIEVTPAVEVTPFYGVFLKQFVLDMHGYFDQ